MNKNDMKRAIEKFLNTNEELLYFTNKQVSIDKTSILVLWIPLLTFILCVLFCGLQQYLYLILCIICFVVFVYYYFVIFYIPMTKYYYALGITNDRIICVRFRKNETEPKVIIIQKDKLKLKYKKYFFFHPVVPSGVNTSNYTKWLMDTFDPQVFYKLIFKSEQTDDFIMFFDNPTELFEKLNIK